MKARMYALLVVAIAACVGCSDSGESRAQTPASLVMSNGLVKTSEGWAEAIAISGDTIVAIGDSIEIGRYVDDETVVVELDGNTVLPGFYDTHVHPLFGGMMYSGANHTNCTIEQGSSTDRLLDTLRECVSRLEPGEWVTGGQWDASALDDPPNRETLDTVSPDTPVIINDTSGHSAWANSKALDLAGIDSDSPDPEGGIIERDQNGEPTGVLRESAIGLVRVHVPPPSDRIIREALSWSLKTMMSYGITSFTEASNGFVAGSQREAELYKQLADEGVLKQRVQLCLNWTPDNWTPDNVGTSVIDNRYRYERDRLKLDCIKLFLDGVPTDSHTAAMLEPYADTVEGRDDEASRYGLLLLEQQVSNDLVTQFDAEGLTVKFHSAGDAAVRSGLDAIEAARNANGMTSLRHNVGHVTFIAREDFARAKDLNATLELSPYLWSPSPINDDITKAVGQERIERVWPFREAIDSGALVVPGSDWAVVPSVNPWLAVEALVTREEPGGSDRSFGKPQAITVEEAIDLFTVNSAIHMGTADKLGQIKAGYLADLIVIDQNPYEVSAKDLHRTQVLATYIGGELVFDATGE